MVPDVHHTVELVIAALHTIYIKEPVPIVVQFGKGGICLGCSVKACNQSVSLGFIDYLLRLDFLLLLILNISKEKDEVTALARRKFHLDVL